MYLEKTYLENNKPGVEKETYEFKCWYNFKSNNCTWELLTNINLTIKPLKKGSLGKYNYWKVLIPKSFLTDFRSGPEWVSFFIPKLSLAFLVHDYLYQKGNVSGIEIFRKTADLIQDDLLKEDPKFNWFQRKAVYIGVRAFGRKFWDYYRRGGEFPMK